MGRWTVIVEVLEPLGAFRSGGGRLIWYPPGNVGGPITFDKPCVAFAQDLGVEPVVGEGVDRLDIFPHRQGCRGVAVLPGGQESGTDLASAPVPVSVGVVSFPTIPRPIDKTRGVLGAGIDKGVAVMESLDLLVVARLLKVSKGIQD